MSRYQTWLDRSTYIPLRLNPTEQAELQMVDMALTVSEYTDKIDVFSGWGTKVPRIIKYLQELCSIMAGLSVSKDFRLADRLIRDQSLSHSQAYFRHLFECLFFLYSSHFPTCF